LPSARTAVSCGAYGLLALALAGACDRARPADPVILALGDQEVRRSEFDRYASEAEARGEGALDAEVRRSLLEAYLERRVLVLEARARGILKAEATGEEEAVAVRKLLAADVLSDVEVTDAEVEQYYREHAAEFEAPETVTLRQILVPTSNEARDVRRRLGRDGKSFAVLAQTMSRAPEASAGGLMGTFARGQLPPELEKAAFALAAGETSEVIQTPLGYHVLHLDARQPSRTSSLAESRAPIRARLLEERKDRKVREYVAGLLARAKVNHEAAIVRTP
jgi:parvulin-like peptidyl-prolyl isomerase